MKNDALLWFDAPATNFLESFSIGNGRLGASVYGELLREQVVLNENTIWSGSKEETDRDDAFLYLPEIRKLLADGKNYEAEQLFLQHFTCQGKGSNLGHGSDACFGSYQILGRVLISYFQAVTQGREDCYGANSYKRWLNLQTGVVCTEFASWGIHWKREWIASKEHQALYLNLTADKDGELLLGKINFSLGLDRDECYEIKVISNDTLFMCGQLHDGKDDKQGVEYACYVKVVAQGGSVLADGIRLRVKDADTATIIITAGSSLEGICGKNKDDFYLNGLEVINKAAEIPFETAKTEYIEWYQKQSQKTTIEFDSEDAFEQVPINKRLENFRNGMKDPKLVQLYIQFAKHLLIGSSQKGDLPSNLQGIWTEDVQSPWNGDWHLNAQQELYWLAEKAGLSENHLPFIELTKELVEPGKKTAEKYYHSTGWVVHTMTNPWKMTSPMEDAGWGSTVGSVAWQCHHLFEHYLYTKDKAYLADVWPTLKDGAQFFIDMLIEDKKTGYLVTSPSSSPENRFYDSEGRECALCEGPAYDRELVAALFEYCIEAQYVLQNDPEFLSKLMDVAKRLAPVEIGPDGRIMEWGKAYSEVYPFHRHLSHLWAVYPGYAITKEHTPELAMAAKKSLLHRGTTTAGWACAYRACVAARLRDGDAAYQYVKDAFETSTATNLMNLAYHCDETLLHHDKPVLGKMPCQFQMDGNQANATALLLMLEDDEAKVDENGKMSVHIYLLPALPKDLPSGRVKRMSAKGNLFVNVEWKDHKLVSASIEGEAGTEFTISYKDECRQAKLNEDGIYEW